VQENLQLDGIDCGLPVSELFNRERTRVRRWVARPWHQPSLPLAWHVDPMMSGY